MNIIQAAGDHENHKRGDNRWTNLYEVTRLRNSRNQSLRPSNKGGRIGVHHATATGMFLASIHVNGRNKHLDSFCRFADACAARSAAERRYGYAKGHRERAT